MSLETVFPARDSSLWTVVRLALWLVYGSVAVARLTGLLHSTMTSAWEHSLRMLSKSPCFGIWGPEYMYRG